MQLDLIPFRKISTQLFLKRPEISFRKAGIPRFLYSRSDVKENDRETKAHDPQEAPHLG